MKLIAGNSNRPLAEAVSAYLNVPLTQANVRRFSDMEVFVEIEENIRGEDVFVIQSTSFPANDNLMELLVMLDALRRASARRVTAAVPYYGYARQDRKTGPRTPISAKLVSNLITTAGANRLLTIDLHAGQIQGFFDIPVDNLFAAPVFTADIGREYGKDNGASEVMIVSPDVGGVLRARGIARRIGADLAIIDKRRERAGVSAVMNIIGDVKGRVCILVDDIVDSAGTLCNASDALMNAGAEIGGGLCDPRRAFGRRGGADRRLAHPRNGHHRFDPGDRGRPRVRQAPAAQHRAADRRSHPPDQRGNQRQQPVQLKRLHPPQALPAIRRGLLSLDRRGGRSPISRRPRAAPPRGRRGGRTGGL